MERQERVVHPDLNAVTGMCITMTLVGDGNCLIMLISGFVYSDASQPIALRTQTGAVSTVNWPVYIFCGFT